MHPVRGERRGQLPRGDQVGVRTLRDKEGNRRYAVEFEVRGHRVFRRLPAGASKEQALQLETRLKHDYIDQAVIGKKPNVTLRFAIDSWLAEAVTGRKSETATRSHAGIVKAFEAAGGGIAEAIFTVADAVRESALAPGTMNRRLCVLKAVAKYAWRQGWTEENLSARIQLLPERKYQRKDVTPAMAQALIEHASTPRAKALIALSAYTGLRLGEVLKLRKVDVKGGVIIARDTKNGTDRLIPVLPELEPYLKEIPFKAGWRNVYRGFLQARKRAGLSVRYHDLRHMVGSALTNTGADLRLVGDILGHESLQTTRRYTHPNLEAKRRVMALALSPIGMPIRRKAKKAA